MSYSLLCLVMSSCCLCKQPLSTNHRKRKKLYRSGWLVVREVIQRLAKAPLTYYRETSDQLALICYSCEKLLLNISSYEAEVEALKSEALNNVSSLHPISDCNSRIAMLGFKRRVSEGDNLEREHINKHPALLSLPLDHQQSSNVSKASSLL